MFFAETKSDRDAAMARWIFCHIFTDWAVEEGIGSVAGGLAVGTVEEAGVFVLLQFGEMLHAWSKNTPFVLLSKSENPPLTARKQ